MFWPTIPLAGLIDNPYSVCVERQVTDIHRSYSRGLYNRSLKEKNRPEPDVQHSRLATGRPLRGAAIGAAAGAIGGWLYDRHEKSEGN